MKKIIAGLIGATIVATALAGCAVKSQESIDRESAQATVTLQNSLGIQAQRERLSREEDTTAIRYVYLINYGTIFGYYVIKGGVYGADTQIAPETSTLCNYVTTYEDPDHCFTVESAKDDGTYGGDEAGGVFFITSDDVLVETTLDYIQSDAPLAVDVPRLDAK